MQGFCVSLALGFAMIHCLVKKNKSETETGSFLPKKKRKKKMIHLEIATYEKDVPTVTQDSILRS